MNTWHTYHEQLQVEQGRAHHQAWWQNMKLHISNPEFEQYRPLSMTLKVYNIFLKQWKLAGCVQQCTLWIVNMMSSNEGILHILTNFTDFKIHTVALVLSFSRYMSQSYL